MIKSFANKETEALFCECDPGGFPPDIMSRAKRKLDMVDAAFRPEDLRVPPGNRLHRLQGDRFGFCAIAINDQWRIYFKFEGEDAHQVGICDYH